MYGLDSQLVQERVLRRHYGIVVSVKWDPDKYPNDMKWRDEFDGTWRVDVMKWYVRKVHWPENLEIILGTTNRRW